MPLAPYTLLISSRALIFKAEQTFTNVNIDYSAIIEMLREMGFEIPKISSMVALPYINTIVNNIHQRMPQRSYLDLRKKLDSAARDVEMKALLQAKLHNGVVDALKTAHTMGWLVVVLSDIDKVAIKNFIRKHDLINQVDMILARSHLGFQASLESQLRSLKPKVKTLANCIYICNSSSEIKQAKLLGMECFALPSPYESFRELQAAGADGIILTLEELPLLLKLQSKSI